MKHLFVTLSSVPKRDNRVLVKFARNVWKVGTVKAYSGIKVKVLFDDKTTKLVPAFSQNLYHLADSTRKRQKSLTDEEMLKYVRKNAFNKI